MTTAVVLVCVAGLAGCATTDHAGGADLEPLSIRTGANGQPSTRPYALVTVPPRGGGSYPGSRWYDHRNDWRDSVPSPYGYVYVDTYSETVTRDRQGGGGGGWARGFHGSHGDAYHQTTYRTTVRQSVP